MSDREPEPEGLGLLTGGRPRSGWYLALRVLAALTAGLLWVLVIVDHEVSQLLGVHLTHGYVIRELLEEGSLRDLALGRATFSSALAAAALLALVHVPVLAMLERRMGRRIRPRSAAVVAALAASLVPLGVAFLGGGGMADRLAGGLYSASLRVSGRSPGVKLCYPRPGRTVPTLKRRRSVLVVVVESLRGDVFGPELMPELWELARQGSCVTSGRHYSGGHETNGGLFSILYGLNAYYWPEVNRERVRSWPLEVLRENGYVLIAAAAAPLGGRRPSAFWMEPFDIVKEFVGPEDPRNDRELVEWFVGASRDGRLKQPFFALLCLDSTHHNYHYPPEFERFTPVLPANYDHFLGDHALERFRTGIFNRYRNSVLWVDHLLAGLVGSLRGKIESGELLVVVTGDHGEEFWDHGLLGHAASHLVDARTRVPFLLFARGPSGSLAGVTSHVDILPTVLEQLGPEPPLDPASYSDGVALLAAPARPDRIAVVSAADRSLGDPRLALVVGSRKLVVDARGIRGSVELRGVTDLDDRTLPADEGVRALNEISVTLRERLYRFVVPDGEPGPPGSTRLARP